MKGGGICSRETTTVKLTDIIFVPPFEANLQVMVLGDGVVEFLQDVLAFVRMDFVDVFRKGTDGEDTLPPGDGVGAHDGMDGRERPADVLWRAARVDIEGGTPRVGGFDEAVTDERGRQTLEEMLDGFAEALVDLVAGGPQCVAAGLGQLDQPQAGVVGGDRLELDVAVPLRGVVASLVLLVRVREELLAVHRGDVADLGVVAEFSGPVEHGVNVQCRCRGLTGQLAQALYKFLLELVGEVVLCAEEDDASLADLE